MNEAFVHGAAAPLDTAVAEAARLLGASRLPVIAGLGTDVAGARAALALTQRLGGVVDHMHGAALLRDLDVMREGGMMLTTPNETRVRADLLLLVGAGLVEAWPELPARLITGGEQRIVRLCPGAYAAGDGETVGGDPETLPVVLAALRARCAGRPAGPVPADAARLDALAADLKAARFGVAVWSAADLSELAIEMLCGLVKDLNDTTRFSGLPLAPPDNAAAVQLASAWTSGFPLRTGFTRGYWEHDPWRFDATRLVDSGEADCALWISAYGPHAPGWRRKLPLIVIGADATGAAGDVAIAVGRPGVDHASVELLAATGTLAPVAARAASERPSVADVLQRIAAALPEAPSC